MFKLYFKLKMSQCFAIKNPWNLNNYQIFDCLQMVKKSVMTGCKRSTCTDFVYFQ